VTLTGNEFCLESATVITAEPAPTAVTVKALGLPPFKTDATALFDDDALAFFILEDPDGNPIYVDQHV